MVGALTSNLSLLLRTLFGVGTPKQWLAGARGAALAFLLAAIFALWRLIGTLFGPPRQVRRDSSSLSARSGRLFRHRPCFPV